MSVILKRTKRAYSSTWVATAVSAVSLLLLILAGAGVITQEQSAEAAPVLNSTIQAVSVVIAGVLQIINIFFKQEEPII